MSSADPSRAPLPVASRQDGEYPRPQLMRAAWRDLDGVWSFRHDDENVGLRDGWASGFAEPRDIVVPFPPESSASGVDEPGFHPVVWYSRTVAETDLVGAGLSPGNSRLILHLGAVDYRARVYVDGAFVGEHEGGHTPFEFDVTEHLTGDETSSREHLLVVRAEDDPHDVAQPRGKQDWHEHPHAIWYRRTTGIWQTVWLEAVPVTHVARLRWSQSRSEVDRVTAGVVLDGPVPAGTSIEVALRFGGDDDTIHQPAGHGPVGPVDLATVVVGIAAGARRIDVPVALDRQTNGQGQDELFWSPETPRLIDATVILRDPEGRVVDAVASYLGLRTVGVDAGAFLLNDRPYDVRSVLNQGYWPTSHLAAPTRDTHRQEVLLIKQLGFTATRLHQKVEDPRFLYWADRLGLLVWGEAPGAYEFSATAVQRLMREWMDVVERDASHPAIVTWVPANESWGVQQIALRPDQQAYARSLADVSRALDPSRPVISNDGWEHVDSDIVSVHDYEGDGAVMAARYADDAARARLLASRDASGRAILVGGAQDRGQPVMLTEFGGVDYQPGAAREESWGYSAAVDGDDWLDRITALYDAIRASSFLAGSCYTQFTDTLQETNGLLTAEREPKVPIERIRAAVTGSLRP